MLFVMDLRERMKRLRLRAGLSQDALASALGRPQPWVSRRELGATAFKPDDVAEWAEACGYRSDTVLVPQDASVEELLDALTDIAPEHAVILAEVARALPTLPDHTRDLVLAQLRLMAGRFP